MQAEERTADEDDEARADDDSADSATDAEHEPPADSATEDESSGPDDENTDAGGKGGSGGSDDPNDENKEGLAAPSIGPDTEIHLDPPEERLARHEQSTVDAMGNDKRRRVTDESYGASKTRRLILYGAFVALIAVLVIGAQFLVSEFDKPRERSGPSAPWAQEGVKQIDPAPINFPRNGGQPLDTAETGTGPQGTDGGDGAGQGPATN